MARSCLERLVHSNPLMKLVVMATLLLSDADVFFTYASFHSYFKVDFIVGPILIIVFTIVYIAGAFFGHEQKNKFGRVLHERIREGSYRKKNGSVITIGDLKGHDEVHHVQALMIHEGLANEFFQERAKFIRNLVKVKHSVPFFRLAKFGWMADIPAGDFAGILNANALYSFTLGLPQLCSSIFYWLQLNDGKHDPVITASLTVSVLSLFLSILNVLVAFPKVLNDLEQERYNELERQKDIEAKAHEFKTKMRKERDNAVAGMIGKADKLGEYKATVEYYNKKELELHKIVAEMVDCEREGREVAV